MQRSHVICPKCGDVFHRWGHEKSFSIKELSDELHEVFSFVSAKKKAFVVFHGQNFLGFIESLARIVMAKLGARIASTNIYFIAKKQKR